MSFLGLCRDPVVAKITARSAWRVRDLVDGPRPVSLYLVVPPSDIVPDEAIDAAHPQSDRAPTESLDPDRRQQILLLMLEQFAALGRLDFFESQLAFGRLWHPQLSHHSSRNQLERKRSAEALWIVCAES
ncbi:type IV secretory system conjugative DNA transfer family protein [Bradyrhizobium sp. LMG 9283]|uniref:type IV secretory system conjugative DNA transfer family protein n=1 Tax=Bradyrhizobium sp. LMG 9283 TaxID=592064 RepID=UPI00388DF993